MSSPILSAVKALNERLNTSLANHSNSYASSFKTDHSRLVNALDGLVSMKVNPNSTETPAAHTIKLSRAAKRLSDELANMKTRAFDNYAQGKINLTNQIHEKAGIIENKYASEIREAFRQLPQSKRLDFISQVIDKKDGASFAAIINAPEILTGINAEMRNNFTQSLYSKVAPELVQELDAIEQSMDIMESSLKTAKQEVDDLLKPQTIQRIESEVQQSMDAQSKFMQAFS